MEISRRIIWLVIMLLIMGRWSLPIGQAQAAGKEQRASITSIGGCLDHSCFDRDPVGLSKQPVYCTDPNYPNADDSGEFFSYISLIHDREGKELAWFRNVYSDACKANWIYGVLIDGTRLKLTISSDKKDEKMRCYPADCSSYFVSPVIGWSNMVNGTGTTTACAYTTANDLNDHSEYSACLKR